MEDPDEPEKVTTEGMLKINCNISNATNYMHSGIKEVWALGLNAILILI